MIVDAAGISTAYLTGMAVIVPSVLLIWLWNARAHPHSAYYSTLTEKS
ncbi:hypothetical protein [Candidatus Pantoea bituminis]|nr:hypothetical protein [Pantoea bituminis]